VMLMGGEFDDCFLTGVGCGCQVDKGKPDFDHQITAQRLR
jgi:hypothetical protein